MADSELDQADHFGEFSDIVGMGGNILQALDQGVLGLPGGFLPGTGSVPGANGLLPETRLVQDGFNGLGAITGVISAVQGWNDMTDDSKWVGDRIAGGLNVFSGGFGAAGSIAGTVAPEATGFFGGLSTAGGAEGFGASALSAEAWGAGAGGAAAGVGTALATAAAVVGAGTAGWGVGRYGDKATKELGWLADAQGRDRSISEWGSDLAVEADEGVTNFIGGEQGSLQHAIGGGLGTAAGWGTSLATSLAGVPIAVDATATNLDRKLGGVPRSLFGSVTGTSAVMDLGDWLRK